MNRKTLLGPGQFYHVYNQGKNGQEIFINHCDYFRFTLLLYVCNNDLPVSTKCTRCVGANYYGLSEVKRGKPLVDIVSHSLMSSRFHILVRERRPGNLSKFMAKLATGYTMYFNRKYSRQGPLLAGPFKSIHVHSDAYIKYLFAYIHLKPLAHRAVSKRSHPKYLGDAKIRDSLKRYEHSSYLDYIEGDRKRKIILDTSIYNQFFKRRADFEQNIFDWLRFDKTKDLSEAPDFFYQENI
jgi:putative transposase